MQDIELERTELKLSRLTSCALSDPNYNFSSVVHFLNVGFLKGCFTRLDGNKAVGIDQVTKEEYAKDLQSNLEDLVSRLKRKAYRPLPARRVYIPKADGKQRPLGISALENKIVECGIKRILESVYEADFMESSYGYRPNCPRGTEEG